MADSAPETGARVIPITSAASRRQDPPEAPADAVAAETPAPEATPEKPARTRAPAKKGAATKAPAEKAPAKKTAATTAPAKKTAATTAPAKKTAATTAAAKKTAATKVSGTKAPAEVPADTAAADPTVAGKPPVETPAPPAAEEQAPGTAGPESPHADVWERRVAGALAFVRRRLTGEYEIDEFGFDRDLTENVLAAPFRPLYEKYWRVEVFGLENVPSDGSALVVGNHSGTMAALDAVMVQLALLDEHPAHRHLRMLGADLVFSTPFVGELARKSGSTLACNADAERLLCDGHVVGVWPEGFKGIGKPFSERYKLQRFGRGGFVSAALKTGAPIVPVSIVGAEEIYPMLGNAKTLARVLGLPYFPLTPTFPWLGPLGLVPLPSKWLIEFGTPIETAHLVDQADDPMLVFNLTDQVRETIQQTLYRLLLRRESVFS
jgi:1-acyl-sn-glycerol-3-phosphate acyltransferase